MAAPLGQYANAYLAIAPAGEGFTILTQATTVSIKTDPGFIPVDTMGNGFAGGSKGSGKIEISIAEAIPSKDFEFNPSKFQRKLIPVSVAVFIGARQLQTQGFITGSDYQASVNAASSLSMTLICREADFE